MKSIRPLLHLAAVPAILAGLCLVAVCGKGGDDPVRIAEAEGIPTFSPFAGRPQGSVLPDSVESCAIYQETTCVDGTVRQCNIYDGQSDGWVEEPDPMFAQAYWYDRYYDLSYVQSKAASLGRGLRLNPKPVSYSWSFLL